ncbi:tuberin-like isoform X2 [Octopus sinensis]|uniref:Tuberin-like isoform X2 n=1 Tax=Octopus sinensis TaxID=2607531 RepID=A0A6P7SRW8_9MOLL|nr:tuberin-like isoform X2 [Octopus sinensis]
MSRPSKSEEKFKDKLRNLFKFRNSSPPAAQKSEVKKEFVFTFDILQDIGPKTEKSKRINLIKSLSDVVVRKSLEENAVAAIWQAIKDLVESPVTEDRHVALAFLLHLIKGQKEHLGLLRSHFFNIIKHLTNPEDFGYRLELFSTLTSNGKNLTYFEAETAHLLAILIQEITKLTYISNFLTLVVNAILNNVGYFDEQSLSTIIQSTCMLITKVKNLNDIKQCVELLGLVIDLQCVPANCLTYIVTVLCRTLNIRNNATTSWEVMRKLLSTHLGHHVIHIMCCLLEEKNHPIDEQVLRAAVYYLGMALWGSKKVTSLSQPPSSVLPSFRQVLDCGSQLVAFEVTLSLGHLVKRYGQILTYAGWDIVLDILSTLLKNPEWSPPSQVSMEESLHSILTDIETLQLHRLYSGSTTKLFCIIESCATKRPAASVISLIDHTAESLHPGEENWIENLQQLLEKYFSHEIRTEIRIKALQVLSNVLSVNRQMYEDKLVEIVSTFLHRLETDPDSAVRKAGAELLLSIVPYSRHHKYLLEIIYRVIKKPVQLWLQSIEGQNVKHHLNDPLVGDTRELVKAMVDTFKAKILSPPGSCCLCIYNLLVQYASFQYSHPLLVTTGGEIRCSIIECLLLLRCNSKYQIGLAEKPDSRKVSYSPHLLCKINQQYGINRSPPATPTHQASALSVQNSVSVIDFSQTLLLFSDCLKHERDWNVWKCFLNLFPNLLRNKTLVLSERGQLIDLLCHSLCNLITDRNLGLPRKLIKSPSKFTTSDFQAAVFPVLSAIVTYQSDLQRSRQMELINCFKIGLVSRCPQLCMNALRMCAFEMPDAMTRFLPDIILSLSKISSTIYMGIPVLTFLSTIVRFPNLYMSFTSDQYLSIFAIAMPYTNPFKFSHFMVSLAYHVIAAWFTHCRVEWRWHFVKYVQKSLSRYVQQEFEENAKQRLKNCDTSHSPGSSNSAIRARAGSCESADKTRRRFKYGSSLQESSTNLPINEKTYQFHMELTETCVDMMSRYTHANFAAVPKRPPLIEFLLAGGRSKSWLVGHKIISITTSGGGKKVGSLGVCEKCIMLYRQAWEDSSAKKAKQTAKEKQRHKLAGLYTRSNSHIEQTHHNTHNSNGSEDLVGEKKRAVDDMGLLDSDQSVFLDENDPLVENQNTKTFFQSSPHILPEEKSSSSSSTMFLPNQCNCWTIGWAEVRIRSPSGSISWMMRIENSLNPYSCPSDLPVADISVLQIPVQQQSQFFKSREKCYSSGTFSDDEYENHSTQQTSLDQELKHHRNTDFTNKEDAAASSPEEEEEEEKKKPSGSNAQEQQGGNPVEQKVKVLKKSTSSPSLLSYSQSQLQQVQPKRQQTPPLPIPSSYYNDDPGYRPRLMSMKVAPTHVDPDDFDEHGSLESIVPHRPRGQTISIPSPHHTYQNLKKVQQDSQQKTKEEKDEVKGGIDPSFVFLQLYDGLIFLSPPDIPLLLPNNQDTQRSLDILDFIPSYETHKIGVLYVGENQCNSEVDILSNQHGSNRYQKFIESLGQLIHLKDTDGKCVFLGGLDGREKSDGQFTYSWHDEFMQVIFHIATLMPNMKNDKLRNNKKRHIGNDYVNIVYNNSEEDYAVTTLRSEFNFVNIIIEPLDCNTNAVKIVTRENQNAAVKDVITSDIAESLGQESKTISDDKLAALVRLMAIHCNLASMVLWRQKSNPKDPFASNWLERLRHMKRLRSKVMEKLKTAADERAGYDRTEAKVFHEDFTDYS